MMALPVRGELAVLLPLEPLDSELPLLLELSDELEVLSFDSELSVCSGEEEGGGEE